MLKPGEAMLPREQQVVVIERTYRASVDELWALWTTKEGFESWWGPEGYRVEVRVIEPRRGGSLEYQMVANTGDAETDSSCESEGLLSRSRFAEFQLYRRLVLVHIMDFIAGTEAYDHRIEVDFSARVGATTMVVTVHPHSDPDRTSTAIRVFLEQLERLGRRLAATT